MEQKKIEKVFKKATTSKHIYDATFLVEKGDGDVLFSGEHGSKTIHSPIIIASISKLFTTTCIIILLEQGKLSLQDKISLYIDANLLKGLHHFKGKDYTEELTISHLLFQTSGLPDIYEEGKDSLVKRIVKEDFTMTINEVIERTKPLSSYFTPSEQRRAHYNNINFDLLSIIIERITNKPYELVCKSLIFDPLQLKSTYFISIDHVDAPSVYYYDQKLYRPMYLSSFKASGGAISTTYELMIFIKAFMKGKLFDKQVFSQLNTYYRLQRSMFPIQYGGGYMRISLKNIFSLFLGQGELIGHSASTGSFAFYCPHRDLFMVGDINQMTKRALPIQMLMQVVFGK